MIEAIDWKAATALYGWRAHNGGACGVALAEWILTISVAFIVGAVLHVLLPREWSELPRFVVSVPTIGSLILLAWLFVIIPH